MTFDLICLLVELFFGENFGLFEAFDDVLLLRVRSIPELGTYGDLVGKTSGLILPLVGMGKYLANPTALLGGCRRY